MLGLAEDPCIVADSSLSVLDLYDAMPRLELRGSPMRDVVCVCSVISCLHTAFNLPTSNALIRSEITRVREVYPGVSQSICYCVPVCADDIMILDLHKDV